jgi:hypothetical protein
VLGVQGDVAEHLSALADSGACGLTVKTPAQLAAVDGLIIPGGESTTVIRLLERFGLDEPIVAAVRAGLPLWGTCMGLIVAAREVVGVEQRTLGLIDVSPRPRCPSKFRPWVPSRFRRSSSARPGSNEPERAWRSWPHMQVTGSSCVRAT